MPGDSFCLFYISLFHHNFRDLDKKNKESKYYKRCF